MSSFREMKLSEAYVLMATLVSFSRLTMRSDFASHAVCVYRYVPAELKGGTMARILVVDDDAAIRTAMRFVLEHEGYEVGEAGNGNEAMEQARTGAPDLILCDIFMPLKDGFETIRELRRECPTIPIVAISGASSGGGMDVLRLARHLGAADVLYKPLHHAGLLGVTRRLLNAK
jgi:CheY-like chemotaxis protein